MADEDKDHDLIDDEFYEEIEPEEMLELLEEERKKSKQKPKGKPRANKTRFPKWVFGVIALALFLNVIAFFPRTFSIPVIDFLITSSRLSSDPQVQDYKEAVVVIETTDGKGTGFGISENGLIVTNHHVVAGEETVLINYPEDGLFEGEVMSSAANVDLALVKVPGEALPYLSLAEQADYQTDLSILFIGNPLGFNGIANEGEWIGISKRQAIESDVMMLEAPVYRGNSGSPVIDPDGQVIGVIYATTNDEDYGRIGLAIPIDQIHQLPIEQFIQNE